MAWGPFGDETRRIGEHHKKDPNLDRSPDFRSKRITFHINFGISENPKKRYFYISGTVRRRELRDPSF